MHWFTIAILILFWPIRSHAQFEDPNNFSFKTYTTEHGLPDNSVVKIITDPKGFLWIATRNGLSRFDGSEFKNYTLYAPKGNGLRSSWITDLIVDKTGALWVSTEWGLCYYDAANDRFNYVNKKEDLVILYKAPMCIEEHILWIATESGLKKVNTYTKEISSTSLHKIPDPQSICADDKGDLWIGTRGNGFYVYNISKNEWKSVFLPALPKNAHLMGLFKDKDGLWAATGEGMLQIHSPRSASLYNKSLTGSSPVDELMFVTSFKSLTGDSILICGTYNKRMAFFNKNTKKFITIINGSTSLMHGLPGAVLNDATATRKILWIGTDMGLSALNTEAQDFTSYLLKGSGQNWENTIIKKILPNDVPNQEKLILMNKPGGVFLYNTSTAAIKKIWKSRDATRKYKNMLTDQNKNIWLIHEHGIDKFSVGSGITPEYYSSARLFYSGILDEDNNLWLGTDEGLMRYAVSGNKADYFKCGFSGTKVENSSSQAAFLANEISSDNKGKIWIASTKYGLFSFDKYNRLFTAYRQPSQEAYETKNRCMSLSFDKTGTLWLGTLAGLAAFDTALKKFINYDQKQGLLSGYVYSIVADSANNIIGRGNSGVFHFNTKEKKFTNYKARINMSPDILEQKVSLSNGKAFIGFTGGFSVYNIHHSVPSSPLAVYILGCDIRGEKIPLHENTAGVPIKLNYRQNVLRITYTCIDYNFSDDITFRYRLNGAENEWINAGTQRSVLYTDLAPGNYVFTVSAISNEGKTSDHPALFRFTIYPPFWQTIWFKILTGVIFTLIIYWLIKKRITRIKKEAEKNTEINKGMAELEMKALRSQMNPHFIFNSLNSIQKYIWENRKEDASEYLIKFARLIRLVLENSMHSSIKLSEELAALRLYIEMEHRRNNQKFDYSITVNDTVDEDKIYITPLLLQPYIENAIWHGLSQKEERGKLSIAIERNENALICIIDDDGIGRKRAIQIETNKNKTSLGINISSQRIEWLQKDAGSRADVEITDKYDGENASGTKVVLTLPLIVKHA